MNLFHTILQLVGGLAIFIFGVQQLSDGLEKVAGLKLLAFLEKAAGNRIKGMLFGTAAVGLLQSSSMLMVTMIGLINAGMLNLEQAVGIMLGSEIGTTITGQIVSLNLQDMDLVLLILGFLLLFFTTNRKLQMAGQPLFGIGLVFTGMRFMSASGQALSQLPGFLHLLEMLSRNVLLGVLMGAVFTALIQSSSAMTGLVIAMGSAHTITLPVAVSFILGANIGTCVTGWLASFRSSLNSRRASYAQIFINIGGVLLFLPFIAPYSAFVANTSALLPRQIANAHTIFNVAVSLLLLPFVKPLTKLIKRVIRETGGKEKGKATRYIDERFLRSPLVALSTAKAEVLRMGALTRQMLKDAEKSFTQGKLSAARAVLQQEPDIDQISHQVDHFMEGIPTEKLNEADRATLAKLNHLVTDIERVGDHAVNLAEFALQMEKKEIKFTKYARKELKDLFDTVVEQYGTALKAFKQQDLSLLEQVTRVEDEVDKMEKAFKKNHIKRLRKGLCQPEADPIYVETLRNLERISDHAYNIGLSLIY